MVLFFAGPRVMMWTIQLYVGTGRKDEKDKVIVERVKREGKNLGMCGLFFYGSCRDDNEEDDILAPEDKNERVVAWDGRNEEVIACDGRNERVIACDGQNERVVALDGRNEKEGVVQWQLK